MPLNKYLAGYPPNLLAQVKSLLTQGRLGDALRQKYPQAHAIRTDRALYEHVQSVKASCLRNAGQISKVHFDSKLRVVQHALGTHTSVSRVQGGKLKSKCEIRIASLFRDAPEAFLNMIVAHELAHMKEREHDKAFYQLCCHIEPDYHQLEFDLRVYLCHLASRGEPLWGPPTVDGQNPASGL